MQRYRLFANVATFSFIVFRSLGVKEYRSEDKCNVAMPESPSFGRGWGGPLTAMTAAPSLLGEGGGRGPIDWSKLLKVLIAVLTAIAGSLGVVSCMS